MFSLRTLQTNDVCCKKQVWKHCALMTQFIILSSIMPHTEVFFSKGKNYLSARCLVGWTMNVGNQSRSQKMHRMLKLGAFCGCFFNYLSAYKHSLFSWFDVQNYRTCNILFLEQLLAPRVSGGIFVTVQLVEFKNRLEKTTKIPSAHCV